jgi:hypothetical protein
VVMARLANAWYWSGITRGTFARLFGGAAK